MSVFSLGGDVLAGIFSASDEPRSRPPSGVTAKPPYSTPKEGEPKASRLAQNLLD